MTARTTRPRPAKARSQGEGVPGHVPPPLPRERALLGVERAAVEVAAARQRLGRAADVARAAGASEADVAARTAGAELPLPQWMPPGGGPRSFGS